MRSREELAERIAIAELLLGEYLVDDGNQVRTSRSSAWISRPSRSGICIVVKKRGPTDMRPVSWVRRLRRGSPSSLSRPDER